MYKYTPKIFALGRISALDLPLQLPFSHPSCVDQCQLAGFYEKEAPNEWSRTLIAPEKGWIELVQSFILPMMMS